MGEQLKAIESLLKRLYSGVHAFLIDRQKVQAIALWGAACVTGLVAVQYARIFKFLETQYLAIAESRPIEAVFLSPLLLCIAWWLVRRLSPEAGGSGIPQILAANELDFRHHSSTVDKLLSPRVALVKLTSSLLAVAGGAAIGREGPTLQISACIFHFFGNRVRKHFAHIDSHTWIIAGAAAGLASAFNTPLGGIVYAIEEMGTLHFHRVKTSVFSAVIIAGLMSQWLLGPYLYLGFPKLLADSFMFLPYAVLTGAVAGALGAGFGELLSKGSLWKQRLVFRGSELPFVIACGFALSGLIWLSHDSSGSGKEVINRLLFTSENSSLLTVLYRTAATAISYLSGAAGGIFAPSLSAGAALGSTIDVVVSSGHKNLMVMIGMIGFLTGVTRTPFTSFILVLEMSDRHSAIFPMMVTAIVANGAAHFVSAHGFYEKMKTKFIESSALAAPATRTEPK